MRPYRGKRVFLITDENVFFYYNAHLKEAFEGFVIDYLIIKPGEASKSLHNYQNLTHQLLEKKIQRDDLIIAFGGGVVGDLAGFVAATILRGVSFIQVPTTLLSMVDASIGSKVGIDTSYGKNLLGAFKDPLVVIIDPSYLKTLPQEEIHAGMGEVIKACFIGDPTLYDDILNYHLEPLIQKAIAVKKAIVEEDYYESNKRRYLNFGHSFAHAIEQYSNYGISHGYAVSMGMDLSMRLGIKMGFTTKETLHQLHTLLRRYHLGTFVGSIKELIPYLDHDKKSVNDHIGFVFVKEMGQPVIKTLRKDELYDKDF